MSKTKGNVDAERTCSISSTWLGPVNAYSTIGSRAKRWSWIPYRRVLCFAVLLPLACVVFLLAHRASLASGKKLQATVAFGYAQRPPYRDTAANCDMAVSNPE